MTPPRHPEPTPRPAAHVCKRTTLLGRWAPVAFYLLNIARQRHWRLWHKGAVAIGALVPLGTGAVVLSVLLNATIGVLGVQ